MEARKLKRCPIGIQTFSDIIEENYMYVDKTDLVYELAHGDSRYVFLSRPRRFGKSLLASTLHSYFTGRKELFKGLKIDKLETEWTQYPVLHFDMSSGEHMTVEALEAAERCVILGCERQMSFLACFVDNGFGKHNEVVGMHFVHKSLYHILRAISHATMVK